jgi:type II secretory pathway pseudopilin PulG
LSVARSELELAAIPEAGVFVPGVENLLYVLSEYPDGRPAVCKTYVNGTAYESDDQGVSTVKLLPATGGQPVEIQAIDSAGRKARLVFQPESRGTVPAFLLRTDKAVYQAGESAQVTILSAEKTGTIYLDVIKDKQTVLTRSVPLDNHKAEYALPLPAGLVGALKVNAYVITGTGEDKGCSRLLYVNPASGLHVAASWSKAVYAPGEVAKVDFGVSDAEGRPAPAALGIAAVDESVFALSENRPGLLREFMDVEGDLLKPRYQIKMFDSVDLDRSLPGNRQGLVQAYLSSLGQTPAGPGIDDLIKSGYIPQQLIDRAREMRGTPAYERLRNDPEYSDALKMLEGEPGLYSMREATGPVKLAAVEAHRKAYYNSLEHYFEIGFFALIFLSPIFVVICLYRGVNPRGCPIVEALIIIFLYIVLASMLLPALAKAKQKAQSSALLNDIHQIQLANQMSGEDNPKPVAGGPASPRIRRDFPETLFWRPELITDDQGKATLEIPLADSITTWRASVDAISAAGRMGTIEAPIPVFQDFFADLDLPVSLSLGDEVSVPVTCYNYLKEPQDIRIHLAAADWFESPAQNLSVHLEANEVRGASFPIKVLRVGNHALRVTAQGAKVADAVERKIRVVPVGERIEGTKNEVLKGTWADTFTVPEERIPDSESLWIKVYPSRFSEIVEGLDSIFQAPYGCFEQTSSTTYPNVLVLDYMKRMGRLTPEIEIKARKFINAGYQRLLTFEVPGGGFEWFGHDPAHVGLTAYGILEFTDMSRVHPVDQAMIDRTTKWLLSKQNTDGSWDWSGGLEYLSTETPATAYVAWAFVESGDESPAVDKALGYIRSHPDKLLNNYQKALAANALLGRNRTDSFGLELLDHLKAAAIKGDKMTHWASTGYSMTYSHDSGMEAETTALCTMALIKAGTSPELVKQALTLMPFGNSPGF